MILVSDLTKLIDGDVVIRNEYIELYRGHSKGVYYDGEVIGIDGNTITIRYERITDIPYSLQRFVNTESYFLIEDNDDWNKATILFSNWNLSWREYPRHIHEYPMAVFYDHGLCHRYSANMVEANLRREYLTLL